MTPGTVKDTDCGRCVACLDKPKFGGKRTRRKRCQAPQLDFLRARLGEGVDECRQMR